MVSASVLFTATRPWSFPVTLCAISVGGAIAYADSPALFSWPHFALTMAGALFVHACVNLINTYGDFKMGVDAKGSADDRSLVDGLLTASTVYRMIVGCIAGALLMLLLILSTMPDRLHQLQQLKSSPLSFTTRYALSSPLLDLLALCAFGLFIGYAYTAPPFYWKYKGLGDICIVLGYGPLLVTGAYYCQLFCLPSLPSLWFSIAPGLLTETILHANNTRDQAWDRQCGAVTLPMKLGSTLTGVFFILIFALSYLIMLMAAISPSLFLSHHRLQSDGSHWLISLLFLSPVLLLPNCLSLIRSFYNGEFKDLCPRCGQFAGAFGLLEAAAIVSCRFL
jgi:1,4-dihydroxy-2-naphthoate octaprenyltransferase